MSEMNEPTPRAGLAQARRLWLHYRSLAESGRPIDAASVAGDLERLVAMLEHDADKIDLSR